MWWPFFRPSVHVVVVCTANICRSPAAEALLRFHLRGAALQRKVQVSSAGTSVGVPGAPPDPRVVSILAERGVSTRGIRARALSKELLDTADYLWAMENKHLDSISRGWADRVLTPVLLDMNSEEVPDPYFGDKAGVREMIERVDRETYRRVQQLAALLA